MAEAIGTAIALGLFFLLTLVTTFLLMEVWATQTNAAQIARASIGERLNTRVQVDQVLPAGCSQLVGQAANTGKTVWDDLGELDLFLEYTDNSGAQTSVRGSYGAEWSVSGLSPDIQNPGIWDPQETADFAVTLNPDAQPGTTGTLNLVAPQGVGDQTYFDACSNYYLHSETVSIGGTNYYLMKRDQPADGLGTTLTATYGIGGVGRRRPALNDGKFVIQLAGVSEIPASTWKITYRVRKTWLVAEPTAHADLDLLVRQSSGATRATIATEVAQTPNISGSSWQTFTVNYSFPGYTVVDPTDYLEIDLFADTTISAALGHTVYFQIDDASLSVANQTKAQY